MEESTKDVFILEGGLQTESPGFAEDIEVPTVNIGLIQGDFKIEGEVPMERALKKNEMLCKIVKKTGIPHIREAVIKFAAELQAK